jgi:hypothetical protein
MYELNSNIADFICEKFFVGKTTLRGKILNLLSERDDTNVKNIWYVLQNDFTYLRDLIESKDKAGRFKYQYGKLCYLMKVIQNQIDNSGLDQLY